MTPSKEAVKQMITNRTLREENLDDPQTLNWVIEILEKHGYAFEDRDPPSVWETYEIHMFLEDISD